MALRHGVETDWRKKYFSSSASSVCASGSRFFSAHARRCGDRLVSLSDSEVVDLFTARRPQRPHAQLSSRATPALSRGRPGTHASAIAECGGTWVPALALRARPG